MGESTEIEKFKIKKIPFNPSGTETGEFPFARSDDIDAILDDTNKLKQENKTDLFIVRAPQGGGKTATIDEIKRDFNKQNDSMVFYSSLAAPLSPTDIIVQVVEDLENRKLISDEVLEKLNYDKIKDMEPKQLVNLLVKLFEEMMDKKELGVWLVDEFDTIVAEEGNVDEKTIKDFLQSHEFMVGS